VGGETADCCHRYNAPPQQNSWLHYRCNSRPAATLLRHLQYPVFGRLHELCGRTQLYAPSQCFLPIPINARSAVFPQSQYIALLHQLFYCIQYLSTLIRPCLVRPYSEKLPHKTEKPSVRGRKTNTFEVLYGSSFATSRTDGWRNTAEPNRALVNT